MIDTSKFHVVCLISNPVNYKSRYTLYRKFQESMERQGLNLWTCEIAQGERDFVITDSANPRVLQLKTVDELWHKEQSINLMVQRLPHDWKYVAVIDADIEFVNTTGEDAWYNKAIDALQTYEVVQLWQNAIDLGPTGETMKVHNSFVFQYMNSAKKSPNYLDWHPGFAWAYTREAWDRMGGMIDFAILGSGDRHMAYAFVGKVRESADKDMSGAYMDALVAWQEQAEKYVRRDIGYLPITITHSWHGKKKNRAYDTRWKILTETQFDPLTDLKKDYQGLWQLADHGDLNSIILRDRIRAYFRQRQEDGIDTE